MTRKVASVRTDSLSTAMRSESAARWDFKVASWPFSNGSRCTCEFPYDDKSQPARSSPCSWEAPTPHLLQRVHCYHLPMGIRNYLIEGLSGTGKTSVCDELQRRGYHAIHGDRELAYQGDPETGEPTDGSGHEYHIWHVDKVKALVADQEDPVTFFCGGSRNFSKFIDLFDDVFVLEVDLDTLNRRLDARPNDEWGGGVATERELITRWHQTKGDVPTNGLVIDATAPITRVVDEILGVAAPNSRGCG